MDDLTVQMVRAADIMAWNEGDEAGRAVLVGHLQTTEGGVVDLLGGGQAVAIAPGDNTGVNALQL